MSRALKAQGGIQEISHDASPAHRFIEGRSTEEKIVKIDFSGNYLLAPVQAIRINEEFAMYRIGPIEKLEQSFRSNTFIAPLLRICVVFVNVNLDE
jgi:hypothetical protein